MQALPIANETADDMRFQAVGVDLLGRFMLTDHSEYACRVQQMSPGSVVVETPIVPGHDERVIFYVDHIGRLEGAVTHTFTGGFAASLRATDRKRSKLAAQLTWLANRHELSLPEDRRHERIAPRDPVTQVLLDDGRRYEVRIMDLSLSGAAVQSATRPAVGTRVVLGSTSGRVVRHLEDGYAIEFAVVQSREALENGQL
ncbi:PilZ domain-containing protein [Mangrovibrevibacter kandeliae]|uniref:PilZ domain-containing protein n=1 Tax=Mangrovibrevibacter kandeliae TaxID=2968473 RepID=UPI0021187D48|nr:MULTISPECIES: PilZ domain-containing protein [unclassified Aurantimonas]MCQ8782703.1 PilZ domain-containing protein [Aurantimonas sp. CSK15Z-1]MCW4114489.1 PilZ domain-containing protein [Aurantimonas sp. MSK8Z-1]